jgi:hypothetical protein
MRVRLKPRALTYRVLGPPLLAYAKLDQRMARALGAAARLIEGFVLTALDSAELSDLTISIYDRASRRVEGSFAWEQPWFERALPRAPARVLVAAAGDGREALALRVLGYDVDAFEPARSSSLAAAVGSGLALQGDFADLVRACQGDGGPLEPLAARRYDAILLGWGSLSHVPEARDRRALFAACHALCPQGPILASFFGSSDGHRERKSRARDWGTKLGCVVRTLRRAEPVVADVDDAFWLHAGVIHLFDREELEALGRSVGRKVDIEWAPYAHATWTEAPTRE